MNTSANPFLLTESHFVLKIPQTESHKRNKCVHSNAIDHQKDTTHHCQMYNVALCVEPMVYHTIKNIKVGPSDDDHDDSDN